MKRDIWTTYIQLSTAVEARQQKTETKIILCCFQGEDALLPAEEKEEEIDSFDLAPYDPDIPVGEFIIFCCLL